MARTTAALLAGAATANITPALGVSINGGLSDRTAQDVHDELHARCLALDDGTTRLAIVVCDSCMMPRSLLDAAKHLAHSHADILPHHILISATHAHSAPTAGSVFQSDPNPEYLEWATIKIADAIRLAIRRLAPAQLAWGSCQVPQHVFNRRWKMKPGSIPESPFGELADQVQMNPPQASENLVEPAGPTDPQVGFLSVRHADGRPLALWANYSLHYVGGVEGTTISADYFGAFARRIKQMLAADDLDAAFVGMMSNGTSGNINNINFRQAGEARPLYAQMERVAFDVASAVHQAHDGLTFQNDVSLAMAQAEVDVGCRVPLSKDIERAKQILGSSTGMPLARMDQVYARETVLMENWPASIRTIVQAMRIGAGAIATLPCETFVETGLAIKEASPLKPTFVTSLANDYAGYLPTADHHRLGGYETWRARSSFLDAKAEQILRDQALKLLAECAQ